jgi:hypothetical protein
MEIKTTIYSSVTVPPTYTTTFENAHYFNFKGGVKEY